jgi:hypothetical protein
MERRTPKRVTLLNDSFNPLSEREIVDATIAFANGADLVINGLMPHGWRGSDNLTEEQLLERTGDRYLEQWLSNSVTLREQWPPDGKKNPFELDPAVKTASVEEFRFLLRRRVRETISLSLRNPQAAGEIVQRGMLVKGVTYNAFGIRCSIGAPSPKGLRFNTEYTFATYVDLVELGVVLLLDDRRGFREKLCECRWEPCGFLFFEIQPPTGRPQRKYCCSEHMLKAHDQNAAKRMKKSRGEPNKSATAANQMKARRKRFQ